MILSASRRTDIPNYYSEWFLNRIREGFLYVRNPINAHQISRINLSPEIVDCIVFWTKNPGKMMERLDEFRDYSYYFQFTLTGYGKDVEPGLPDKRKVLIPMFRELAGMLGKKRVVWRYDPILLSSRYTPEYHLKAFEEIAESLAGYTERVVISFVDLYTKTRRNTAKLEIKTASDEEWFRLAAQFVKIAESRQIVVESCAEAIDLSEAGVRHGSCIDRRLIEEIIGCRLKVEKDKTQRKECGCFESVEVGSYNTCLNGCKYCYANFSDGQVKANVAQYDVNSPLLCGSVRPEDKVTERKVKSLKEKQRSLFD